jgi:hypothetical protein
VSSAGWLALSVRAQPGIPAVPRAVARMDPRARKKGGLECPQADFRLPNRLPGDTLGYLTLGLRPPSHRAGLYFRGVARVLSRCLGVGYARLRGGVQER